MSIPFGCFKHYLLLLSVISVHTVYLLLYKLGVVSLVQGFVKLYYFGGVICLLTHYLHITDR